MLGAARQPELAVPLAGPDERAVDGRPAQPTLSVGGPERDAAARPAALGPEGAVGRHGLAVPALARDDWLPDAPEVGHAVVAVGLSGLDGGDGRQRAALPADLPALPADAAVCGYGFAGPGDLGPPAPPARRGAAAGQIAAAA